ncbi:MAG: methyltransferase domain-containing protein [Candidatus Bathyarchaeota archaeon]|nr:methyltransferase domain-containing protein [Candidatus Bathyarchaeota archaeon]
MSSSLQERIHVANVAVHRFEAKYYELLHPEVYGKQEQKRITAVLKKIDALIEDNTKKALDCGAGTGNLTGKLLSMGYYVTAVDISAEMCAILQKRYAAYIENKKLTVINSPIEEVTCGKGEFDLIACYSVLHHLPDYASVLQQLAAFLKKGGVLYVDHEASPFYWTAEPKMAAHIVKHVYFHSASAINAFHLGFMGLRVPSLDYTYSDYWHKKEHPLNHELIKSVFEKENFAYFKRVDYHLNGTWLFNPIFYLYKRICKPEMSFWIAKK